MKLLIAVKSKMLTDLLVSSLPMYDVYTCNTGPDALAMLQMHHFDALLLELTLPGIDGLSVLQKTGAPPRHILALTNIVNQAVLQAAAAAGVQDLLLLPCSTRHILAHLHSLLQKAPSTK